MFNASPLSSHYRPDSGQSACLMDQSQLPPVVCQRSQSNQSDLYRFSVSADKDSCLVHRARRCRSSRELEPDDLAPSHPPALSAPPPSCSPDTCHPAAAHSLPSAFDCRTALPSPKDLRTNTDIPEVCTSSGTQSDRAMSGREDL